MVVAGCLRQYDAFGNKRSDPSDSDSELDHGDVNRTFRCSGRFRACLAHTLIVLATVYTRPVIRCHLNNGADVNAITFAFLEVDSDTKGAVVVDGLKVNVLPRVLHPQAHENGF